VDENLLTRVARTVGRKQGENVATTALVFLLDRYPVARSAFIRHLNATCAGANVHEATTFSYQQSVTGQGITDISGFRDGSEEVIVEAKIRADFGEEQVAKYVERLFVSAEHLAEPKPLLIILAPRRRAAGLFERACRSAGATSIGWPESVLKGDVELRIGFVTWENTIAAIYDALNDDAEARHDVSEVEGLYRFIEGVPFMSFNENNIAQDVGLLLHSVVEILDSVTERVNADPNSGCQFRSMTPQRWAFGYNGKIASRDAWWGVWITPWATVSPTPYWVQLKDLPAPTRTQVVDRIHQMSDTTIVPHQGAGDLQIALIPLLDVDRSEVVVGLASQLTRLASVL
jgi:hypothetical protein